ncbi:putative Splicing factor-like protein [Giardia duodenalis]|uniref:Splicing factor-like protein n=1 Tax=Giardia intestinalis (strain ATCC 50803 / WB clone C6) TaxID=184922 RepID=A8BTS5_GIAIC|nr:putative Splicing factor-like protein [Giardia intestinalis]KAE8301281.1 putative Splicing factor-like protein [Giardia intestinalis]|eukprot:XP_001704838.1 Splicing factor-like protein, putative [Giardia lamblia ATCC 50803]
MQSLKPRLLQSVQPTLVGSTENSSFPSQPRSMARKLAAMGSLKFLVYAIRKALETMPQPWEAVRYVTVAHQKAGALTYILSKSTSSEHDLIRQWTRVCDSIPKDAAPPSYPIFDGTAPYMCYRDNLAFARPLPLFKTNAIIRFHRLKNLCADLSATQKILLSDSRRSLKSRDKFSFEQHLPSVFTNLSSFHGDDNFLMYQHVYLYHAYTEDQLLTYPALYYPISMHPPANLPIFLSPSPSAFCGTFLDRRKSNLMHINSSAMLSRSAQINEYSDAIQSSLQTSTYRSPSLLSPPLSSARKSFHKREIKSKSVTTILRTSPQFSIISNVDWLEAAQHLLAQAHDAMTLMLHRKNITFLSLDYNFNLTHTKVLSTKERKQSRFGKAFHLVRELTKFLKYMVDTHIAHRLLLIDYPTFLTGIHHLFLNIGTVTSVYRYKYKISNQIRQLKALGMLCGDVPFYHPLQCVMNSYLRGLSPLLEAYLSRLLARTAGIIDKDSGNSSRRVTHQRSLANQIVEQRNRYAGRFVSMYPQFTTRSAMTKLFLAHLAEAWLCWRAGMAYDQVYSQMSPEVADLVQAYVSERADLYTASIACTKKRIASNKWIAKSEHYKYCGRAGRQDMRELIVANAAYLCEPIQKDLRVSLGTVYSLAYLCITVAARVCACGSHIPFPSQEFEYDGKLLELALRDLREDVLSGSILTVADRQLLTLIEKATSLPHEFLIRIKEILLKKRTFDAVQIEYAEARTCVYPIYLTTGLTRVVDVYFTYYLSYQITSSPLHYLLFKRGFSSIDLSNPYSMELPAELTIRYCKHVHSTCSGLPATDGEGCFLVHMHLNTDSYFRGFNLHVIGKVISLLFDPVISSFLITRLSSSFYFKDMTYTAVRGVAPSFQFSHFLLTLLLSILDLTILLHYDEQPFSPTIILRVVTFIIAFAKDYRQSGVPLSQLWLRKACLEKGIDLSRLSIFYGTYKLLSYVRQGESLYLVLQEDRQANIESSKTTIMEQVMKSIPQSIACYISRQSSFCDNQTFYFVSLVNQPIRFEFMGYIILAKSIKDLGMSTNILHSVSATFIANFIYHANQLISSAVSTSFSKIIAKWNSLLLNCVIYYREALLQSPRFLRILMAYEEKVCNKIKQGLNSKMPNRFPNVIFYSPRELGGLGMLSVGSAGVYPSSEELNPKYPVAERSRRWDQKHQEVLLPSVIHFISPWADELNRSFLGYQRLLSIFCEFYNGRSPLFGAQTGFYVYEYDACGAEQQYSFKEISECLSSQWTGFAVSTFREAVFQALSQGSNSIEQQSPLEIAWANGCIPRLTTLIHYAKDLYCLLYRNPFLHHLAKGISIGNALTLKSWYNKKLLGSLYDLQGYKKIITAIFGGVEEILHHTLYPATDFSDYKSVVWSTATEHETGLAKRTNLTRARRQGLSQIPNRRFALWWSPTINRSSVYIGYRSQIDLTGVYMCGKLATLKTAYVSLFRGHAWPMIHSSLVKTLLAILQDAFRGLPLDTIKAESVHPRKSYHYHTSCADISVTWTRSLTVQQDYSIQIQKGSSEPHHNSQEESSGAHASSGEQVDSCTHLWWIDLHLTWGNVDTCTSLAKYSKDRHKYYTSDRSRGIYRSPHGIIICIDLLYREIAAYGSVPTIAIPAINKAISELLESLHSNTMMNMLADRIRTQLGLSSSSVHKLTDITPSSIGDLFTGKVIIVDDSLAYNFRMLNRDDTRASRVIINGFISIFNPQTGRLVLSVVHADTYAGQSRRASLSRWRTADLLTGYISSLPQALRPTTVVVCSRQSIDPIRTLLSVLNPPIVVRGTSLHWQFQNIRSMVICAEGQEGHIRGTVNEVIQLQQTSISLSIDLYAQFRGTDEQTGLILEGTPIQHFIAVLLMLQLANLSPLTIYKIISQSNLELKKSLPEAELAYRPTYASLTTKSMERLSTIGNLTDFVLHLPRAPYQQWCPVISAMTERVINESAKKLGVRSDCLSPAEKKDLVLGAELVISNAPERRTSIFSRLVLSANTLGERMLSSTQPKEVTDVRSQSRLSNLHFGEQWLCLQRNAIFCKLFAASQPKADADTDSSFCRSIIDQAVGATTDNSSRLCVIIGQVTKSQPILPCSGLQAPVALTFGLQHSVTMNGKPRTLIELRHIRAYLGGWDFFSYAAIPITELLQDVKFTEEKTGMKFYGVLVDFSRAKLFPDKLLESSTLKKSSVDIISLVGRTTSVCLLTFYFGADRIEKQSNFCTYYLKQSNTDKTVDQKEFSRVRVHVASNYSLEFYCIDPITQCEKPGGIDQSVSYQSCIQFSKLFASTQIEWEELECHVDRI